MKSFAIVLLIGAASAGKVRFAEGVDQSYSDYWEADQVNGDYHSKRQSMAQTGILERQHAPESESEPDESYARIVD